MINEEVKCPNCGSNQLTTIKKDVEGKKQVAEAIISGAVAVLTGFIGLLVGTLGSRKITFTCRECGHQFQWEC